MRICGTVFGIASSCDRFCAVGTRLRTYLSVEAFEAPNESSIIGVWLFSTSTMSAAQTELPILRGEPSAAQPPLSHKLQELR